METLRARTAAVVVLSLLGLAGCSSDDGDPVPEPRATASSSRPASAPSPADEEPARSLPDPGYQVPAVATPLDVAAYVDDPCALLDADRAAGLELGAGSPTGDGSCRWEVAGSGVSVLVAGVRQGPLSAFHDQYVATGDGSWEPVTVADLPGALVNGPFEESSGSCVLLVAVAADAFLRVERGTTPSREQACTEATGAAEQAVATLAGGR